MSSSAFHVAESATAFGVPAERALFDDGDDDSLIQSELFAAIARS